MAKAGEQAIGAASRLAAALMLNDVLNNRRRFDEAADKYAKKLSPRDRSLALAITRQSLRRLGQIDEALFRFIQNPRPIRSNSRSQFALMILRGAAAQLLFMRVPAHAAVDLAVRIAQQNSQSRPFAKLINAVLRQIAALPLNQNPPLSRSVPKWLWQKWVKTYGEPAATKIAQAHLAEDKISLDLTPKTEQIDANKKLTKELNGVFLAPNTIRLNSDKNDDKNGDKISVEALPFYRQGLWWVQDIAASLAARLFGNVNQQSVLELCAAPGGKTAQLAAAGAQTVAVDRDPKRVRRLRENLARLNLTADIIVKDGRAYHSSSPFRFILLDAPCSGTGTIRRHPEIAWTTTPKMIARLAEQQKQLLRAAYRLLAPDGILVYCVCSLEPEEGIDIINHFLKEYLDMKRKPIQPHEVGAMNHILTQQGDIRSLPFHQPHKSCAPIPLGGMDGFYTARLIRSR